MTRIILTLLLIALTPIALHAGPSSNVAFTPETLRALKAADIENGKLKSASCAGCHGQNGVSANPAWPSVAGQRATYAYKQLRDYKDGTRANALMQGIVAGLSDQDLMDIAAYYATLPMPESKEAGDKDLSAGITLVKRGDATRFIPSCQSCHRADCGGNVVAVPALGGQHAPYLVQTMNAYKSGARANDVYGVMRNMAKEMSAEEISQVSDYYATMCR